MSAGFTRGQRVRITTLGTVTEMYQRRDRPIYTVRFDDSSVDRDDECRFVAADLEAIPEPDNDWRDVCADMIRLKRDSEAVALLVEKAPGVVPYIRALEALYEAFAKLPAQDAFDRMVKAWQTIHDLQVNGFQPEDAVPKQLTLQHHIHVGAEPAQLRGAIPWPEHEQHKREVHIVNRGARMRS